MLSDSSRAEKYLVVIREEIANLKTEYKNLAGSRFFKT